MTVNGAVVVTDPVVVQELVALHKTLWRAGQLPDQPRDGPPVHLAPVLRMLMAGTPDDRAADALGVSPRTYSRRVGELTLLLGVQSRFQAGAEAARRGWLDTPSTAPTSQRR